MPLKPASSRYRWFWPIVLACAFLRLCLSLYLLVDSQFFFTLSADDVARYRIALLWADDPSFFPDPTWPPLPFWLGGLMIQLFSIGPAAMCYLSIAASLLSVPLLGLLGVGLLPLSQTGQRQSQIIPVTVALAVFTFYPQWIWLGTSMLAESLYTMLVLSSFTFFILAVERKTTRWGYAAVLSAVLASMTRLEGIALAGAIYLLLAYRLRKHRSQTNWTTFLGCGAAMVVFFPIVWTLGHSGGAGALDYFATLKEGFTSKYTYNPLRMPLQLFRIYMNVFPLILFTILIGLAGLWSERKKTGMSDLLLYQAGLIGAYLFAQCAAAMAGMMPTHSFWRLTFPIYAVLLPYLGAGFAFLGRFMSARWQIAPALLCIFYQFNTFSKPPVFVTPELYQSGIDIQEVRTEEHPTGRILIEVSGWEWLPLAVLGQGAKLDDLRFDRDPQNPSGTNLNPPLFNLPPESLKNYLESNNVVIVAATTLDARQKMTSLGWQTERSGRYAIFTPPVERQLKQS